MGASVCRCLGCRSARVAPEGPRSSLSWRARSRDEQALEFLSVCAATVEQRQREVDRQRTARTASTTIVFFMRTVTLGIAYPTIYFCVLLPLQIGSIPAWCRVSYYWTCMLVGAAVFAHFNVSACWGAGPHWLATFCVLTPLTALVICLATADATSRGGWTGALVGLTLCVLASIYWPSLHRIWHCAWSGDGYLKDSLFYFAGMMFGAAPCAVATGAYVLVQHLGWAEDPLLVILLLATWSAMPILMKLTGKNLFIRGSPECRAMGPVLWVFYVEVAFACLGLAIFNNATGSAMAYACTFAALLVLQVARGSRIGYRCFPCMGSLSLHRLIIFFESFAALIGRITSYTLFLCFGILRLVSGEVQSQAIVSFADTLQPWTINIYGGQSITVASLLTGMLGFLIVLSIFVAFVSLLPTVWGLEAHGGHEDSGKESPLGPCPELGRVEAWTEQDASASPAMGKTATESSWIQDTGAVPARTMQYQLLLSFMEEYRFLMVSTLVFIFGMCVLLVDLSTAIGAILQKEE